MAFDVLDAFLLIPRQRFISGRFSCKMATFSALKSLRNQRKLAVARTNFINPNYEHAWRFCPDANAQAESKKVQFNSFEKRTISGKAGQEVQSFRRCACVPPRCGFHTPHVGIDPAPESIIHRQDTRTGKDCCLF